MDLPPCPVCGEALSQASPDGPAKCPACGFTTPVEVDRAALADLLEEARERALGARPALTHATQAPEPRLAPHTPPSMLGTTAPAAKPSLSPPPRPAELTAHAPPPLEDPRTTLDGEMADRDRTGTEMASSLDGDDARRRRELGPRGELLR